MGMKKRLLAAAGYAAAPRVALALQHPGKMAIASAAGWAADRVVPRRRKSSMGATAAKGLGAAAVALPVGMWLGRRIFRDREASML